MIVVPRLLLILLAAAISAYHIVLGVYTLGTPQSPWPVVVSMVLYAVATTLSLWPGRRQRMPAWLAAGDGAVSVVMLILVLNQLDPRADNGYATWPIAAVGTLMTIVVVRQRAWFAWSGVVVLALTVLVWADDPVALTTLGVVGSAVFVGVGQAATRAVGLSARDARLYERAARRAVEWHAREEAERSERGDRVRMMTTVATPLLERIVATGGVLDEEERAECLRLEAALRDEIRGRRLLDDEVRRVVSAARQRGAEVSLLDEGGIDELPDADRARIMAEIAEHIGGSEADRIVVRTGAVDDDVAVTVVGLSRRPDEEEDAVTLWLEIPRRA
ncbi:hypothetical protein NY547_03090 [Cnuibacter physcomitrellae]|uniref:hypothetical protein n=1 Tax=Cnuibacter physcomitrellae TaxID=1619308 RepID=UPI0021760388|nr:hypothetical protein [Cnuibacter physcomitrellae]MCS5496223.1 hypothetical protein [Cnuibacter physcomitrellae]